VTPNTGNFSSCAFASAGILRKTHQPQGGLQAKTSGIGLEGWAACSPDQLSIGLYFCDTRLSHLPQNEDVIATLIWLLHSHLGDAVGCVRVVLEPSRSQLTGRRVRLWGTGISGNDTKYPRR
jgi:hypothetical protein